MRIRNEKCHLYCVTFVFPPWQTQKQRGGESSKVWFDFQIASVHVPLSFDVVIRSITLIFCGGFTSGRWEAALQRSAWKSVGSRRYLSHGWFGVGRGPLLRLFNLRVARNVCAEFICLHSLLPVSTLRQSQLDAARRVPTFARWRQRLGNLLKGDKSKWAIITSTFICGRGVISYWTRVIGLRFELKPRKEVLSP